MTKDEEAEFTALVRRQSRFVFRVAYAVLLNSHDAEDVVQETFLKLYRKGGWQRVQNERAFLARVGWRVAVDRRRVVNPAGPVSDLEPTLDPACPLPGPEETLLVANQHAIVHAMVDALPEELRLPLVLSSSDEFNSREIAAILGVPEGTVRTRLQRARQVLRQRLANLNVRNRTQNQETQHA